MRAPALALLATLALAAVLPAQKEGGEKVRTAVVSGVLGHPVERVYRGALDAMPRAGYVPPLIMLYNEALVTPQPVVANAAFKVPTVAEVSFEPRGDSTFVRVEVTAVDMERQAPCGSDPCMMSATAGAVSVMGALAAALDSLPPQVRTAADSLREAKAYGYSPENPIRVGGAVEDGARRERELLGALRGPGGEAVRFFRLGSCCAFVAPGQTEATARIDAYEVTYPGLAKPVVLFFDIYHDDDRGPAPHGFTRASEAAGPTT